MKRYRKKNQCFRVGATRTDDANINVMVGMSIYMLTVNDMYIQCNNNNKKRIKGTKNKQE